MNFIHSFSWYISRVRDYPGIHRRLKDLKDESQLSKHEWMELQNIRLRQVLTFAARCVPYYQKILEQIALLPDSIDVRREMRRIPILTKSIIRENLSELIAEPINKSSFFENTTGGSTGVPLKFFQDQNYQTTAAAIDVFVREWWGIRPYDRTALIWGADREFYQRSLKERLYEWRLRLRSINAFRMTDESLLDFCRMLKRWRPPYLMGYSSALEVLAKCAQHHNINNIKFKAIRSSAEMLWPHQRQLISEVFNSPVYNFYGSREVNNLAAECPEEGRLHLISTWRYIEIVNERGEPLPDGELGFIIVTDLSNYSMPFIRYRNEDMGSYSNVPCPCGRPSPILDKLIGRSTDLIRTPAGEVIHGEYFTHLFYGHNNIRQFQVHQTTLDRLVVRYVPEGTSCSESIAEIVKKIRERLGREMVVSVEECNNIPIPSSGKHRFTISDVTDMNLGSLKNEEAKWT